MSMGLTEMLIGQVAAASQLPASTKIKINKHMELKMLVEKKKKGFSFLLTGKGAYQPSSFANASRIISGPHFRQIGSRHWAKTIRDSA
jgi:hypothetical protein